MKRNNPDRNVICRTTDNDFRGYADHVGFFRYAGFSRGNKPGEARGSRNYAPIQELDLEELRAASGDRPYAEIVEEKADELTRVLVQRTDGDLALVLRYSLRELIRNSAEHSRSDRLTLFGQFWPRKGRAEIVLFDEGIGILQAITEAGHVAAVDDKAALEMAIQPGISGVSDYERKLQNEFWRNSGFGLFVTSRFCAENGLFRIISGKNGLTLDGKKKRFHDWYFSGTCVQMKMDLARLDDSERKIQDIVKEGEALAAVEGRFVSASRASAGRTVSK